MRMHELKEAFKIGHLTKADYIEQMHVHHAHLFEYADFLKDTDIKKIEITDRAVIMTSRSSDIKLICDKDDKRIIPIEILNFDQYENDNMKMLRQLIEDGDTVFDIGGNIGWYSLNIAKMKAVTVCTFEPIPKTYSYLSQNIKLNNIETIHTFNIGFSKQEDVLNFYYNATGSGNASLANLSGQNNTQEISCRVRTLDGFMAEEGFSVDFIKCDVEGAELFVFQGGVQSISKYKPVIFAELLRKWAAKFHYHPNDVIQFLKNFGYRCFTAKDAKLTEFFTMDDKTVENNFFFLHDSKHHSQIQRLVHGIS